MKQFKDYLDNIEYPKSKSSWNISGIIKGQNGFYKFDTRPLKNNTKTGSFKTKADKIVFEYDNKFIILDVEELHKYLKENSLKIVKIEDIISKLDWNITLQK